jgi:hypothetical protein
MEKISMLTAYDYNGKNCGYSRYWCYSGDSASKMKLDMKQLTDYLDQMIHRVFGS